MSAAYWAQWSHSEIMSMHGVELDECHDVDHDFDGDEPENDVDDDSCPRCSGGGCNYCLMVDW